MGYGVSRDLAKPLMLQIRIAMFSVRVSVETTILTLNFRDLNFAGRQLDITL
jgi:hypothetical protein